VTTGPLGSTRAATKFLPGDVLFLSFNIQGIAVDSKTGLAQYQTVMTITDAAKKEVFKQEAPAKEILLLGGTAFPSFAFALLGPDQDAGKYDLKITVKDLVGKDDKTLDYSFEVLPKEFGIVQPVVPAVALAGTDYSVNFSIAGMKFNKDDFPDVDFVFYLEDELGKKVFPKPIEVKVMQLHDPNVYDIRKKSIISIYFPVFLNRAGRYSIVLDAHDKIADRKAQARLPLRVLDPADFAGK
jgi:hypothetical protein